MPNFYKISYFAHEKCGLFHIFRARIFDYFACHRREFFTILPAAGENFGQKSLFSCFLDKFGFSWFSWSRYIFMVERLSENPDHAR